MEYALSIDLKIEWEFNEAEAKCFEPPYPGSDAHISIVGVKALIGDGEYELPKELEEKVVEELEADEDLTGKLWDEYNNQNRGRDN